MIGFKSSIGIIGTGRYLPEKVLTNFDLEKLVDTSDEWIYNKTGIKTRRIVAADEATSDLATKAAKKAMEKAQVAPEDIDLLVLATSSPDTIQPSTACLVQHNLGIPTCAAFDISAVCSGFVYAISVASDIMRGNSSYKTALVVGAETYSRILDWTDRKTCVFFGDGAGAVILGQVPPDRGILGSYLRADGSGSKIIYFPAGGSRLPASKDTLDEQLHSFKMEGRKVWEFAIRAFPDAIENVLRIVGFKKEDIALVVPHQANARLIAKAMENSCLPKNKVFVNVEKYGNTSGASVSIALDEAVENGRIKSGDLIVLVGFGGGLTWGACAIRW